MMTNSWKIQCEFPQGTIIKGKWHHNEYIIVSKLGSGANGIVYLAQAKNGQVALKMSTDSLSVTSEVNVLKEFAKAQGLSLGPSLYDVDDWKSPKGLIHFYVMEYIHGPNLLTFIQTKGTVWLGIMIVQLLDILHHLHTRGWVFGDLKPENLIVSGPPPTIRCIDVGGTTFIGRAIKEFTEFFDRGYWGLGTRKAEPSYDLFSVAMIMINVYYPKRFAKKGEGYQQLIQQIQVHPKLQPLESILKKALLGKYSSALEMKTDMLEFLTHGKKEMSRTERAKKKKEKRKKLRIFLESVAVFLLTIILYVLYIYGYIL